MNRAQRRAYNKSHKTNYSKSEFEAALLLQRLKNGGLTYEDIMGMKNVAHMDNEEIAPEGCIVKLNYDDIYNRPQDDLTDEFKSWVEENKDKEFHLTRDGSSESLVCLKEDERFADVDGERVAKPKWLFDLYSDLFIKTESGEFKHPHEIDDVSSENYTDITSPLNIAGDYLKQTEEMDKKSEENSENSEKN